MFLAFVTLFAIAMVTLAFQSCAGRRAMQREVQRGPRDPATGVIVGCEAVTLDPPAAAIPRDAAILMIHGFLGSRNEYADLGERLAAEGFVVRMMRLPGHGTTPRDLARLSPDDLYRAVESEYRALRGRHARVSVCGFSMGGTLATLLAARESRASREAANGSGAPPAATGPPERLILCAPYYRVAHKWFYLLPVETWHGLVGWSTSYVAKSDRFVQVNKRESVPHIFTYRVLPTRGAATLFRLGKQARDPAIAAAIECPALLVMAEGDEAASPRQARRIFDSLASRQKQSAWFTTRSNHQIFWDYDAEPAKQAIIDFMTDKPEINEASITPATTP